MIVEKKGIGQKYLECQMNHLMSWTLFHWYLLCHLFLTFDFLCSTDYHQYYQNLTNDDIIKLYEKFLPDFLAYGYTLDGFLNKE